MDSFFHFLEKEEVEFYRDVSLSVYSYVSIGGKAKAVVFLDGYDKTQRILSCLLQNGIKFKILGNMTNILVPDEGYDGVVLMMRNFSKYTVAENRILVSAGASFIPLVKKLSLLGIGGFEAISGIPGSIGGMIYGNAGAFGTEISDLLLYADVYFFDNKEMVRLCKKDMEFSYRSSILKRRAGMIFSVALKKVLLPYHDISSKLKQHNDLRKSNQPIGVKSLGSVFKKHNGVSVSKLIDELGLKGYRVGGAKISEKHAGFIVCDNKATANDFLSLLEVIKARVYDSYGFTPEEEIEILV